jgi:NAD(P)H-hydrate repair Nnr-like enzyme with NAD(P)H-hydrate dehydratase domain
LDVGGSGNALAPVWSALGAMRPAAMWALAMAAWALRSWVVMPRCQRVA